MHKWLNLELFLIAYRSYHYAIIQTGFALKWNFRRWNGIMQWYERKSGTFYVGKVLHNGTNERPSLQSYGNMYSRDYNIGLSNLVNWKNLTLSDVIWYVLFCRCLDRIGSSGICSYFWELDSNSNHSRHPISPFWSQVVVRTIERDFFVSAIVGWLWVVRCIRRKVTNWNKE